MSLADTLYYSTTGPISHSSPGGQWMTKLPLSLCNEYNNNTIAWMSPRWWLLITGIVAPQHMNATWNNVSTHNTSYPETIGTIYMRTIWIIAINHHHLINNNVSISIPFDPNPTTDQYDDGFNCLDVPCSATHIHTPPICYCECPVRGALHPVSNQHLLWVSLVSPPVCPPIVATRPVIAPWIHT